MFNIVRGIRIGRISRLSFPVEKEIGIYRFEIFNVSLESFYLKRDPKIKFENIKCNFISKIYSVAKFRKKLIQVGMAGREWRDGGIEVITLYKTVKRFPGAYRRDRRPVSSCSTKVLNE